MSGSHRIVFVSSTLSDLPEYRDAVQNSIQANELQTVDSTSAGDTVDVIKRQLAASQIFVGVYAYLYGSGPDDGAGKSFAELEFDLAGEDNLPRICLIMSGSVPWPDDRRESDIDTLIKLLKFKDRLKATLKNPPVLLFTTPQDLQTRLTDALAGLVQQLNQQQQVAQPGAEPAAPDARERPLVSGHPPGDLNRTLYTNYEDERQLIKAWLESDSTRLISIVGRTGMGKTRLASYMLHGLHPDNRKPDQKTGVTGILYLDAHTVDILEKLLEYLPDIVDAKTGAEIARIQGKETTAIARSNRLIEALEKYPGTCVILIDRFEAAIHPRSGKIIVPDLEVFFQKVLVSSARLCLMITSRTSPQISTRGDTITLDEGLAEREGHEDGLTLLFRLNKGFEAAPPGIRAELKTAFARVANSPRAIEFIANKLAKYIHRLPKMVNLPQDILDAQARFEKLIRENYERFSLTARQIMQVLAVYNTPVKPDAIRALLKLSDRVLDASLDELAFNRSIKQDLKADTISLIDSDRDFVYGTLTRDEQKAMHRTAATYYLAQRNKRKKPRSLRDLETDLAAIDHYIKAEEFGAAFAALYNIDGLYLLPWGNYGTVYRLHKQLEDRIKDDNLLIILNTLGETSYYQARTREAIGYYEQSIKLARSRTAASGTTVTLQKREAAALSGLGSIYGELGQAEKALDHYQQALPVTEQIPTEEGGQERRGYVLINLGEQNIRLGKLAEAAEQISLALTLVQSPEHNGRNLGNDSYRLILQADYTGAAQQANAGLKLATQAQAAGAQSHCGYYLSLAQLCAGDLKAARAAVEKAAKFDEPANQHNILALQGLIHLRENALKKARQSFNDTLEDIKRKTEDANQDMLYDMRFASALARAGLLLCDKNNKKLQQAAASAYSKAILQVGSATGIIQAALLVLNELAKAPANKDHRLDSIRLVLETALKVS